MKNRFLLGAPLAASALLSLSSLAGAQAAPRLVVDFGQKPRPVAPTLHGLFFEDINYGADGGLYAELVQNRSFEHRDAMYAWTPKASGGASAALETQAPLNAKNPRYLRLSAPAGGKISVSNSGYDGISVQAGKRYFFSVRARGTARGMVARLEDASGQVLGQCRVPALGAAWKKFDGTITSKSSSPTARLVVEMVGAGRADVDVVSLFPEDTYNKRRNGLRADMVGALAAMKPGFLRFPGGCIVEGRDLSNAYRWKETIGDIAERPQNDNRWQDAVDPKAPQYYQSYGLGFYEYFLLCEDIGAEPVPVVNCGMACQFQSGQTVPIAELGPYVQDALDLIEFANGPATSTWGAKRAAMGHPKPFNLKFIGVGNEQWGLGYFERYAVFYKAIKAKYPGIQISSTSGPGVDDHWWELAWDKFRSGTPAQVVDEHYYRSPQWFLSNTQRYDNVDRNGPGIFAGEFAAHASGKRNNLEAAVSEAAFMTGLVRNADAVKMASYAPLFAKAGHTQWTPDLIWFDNQRVFGSPSYYVQKMFSENRPTTAFPVKIEGLQPTQFRGKAGVGTWNTQAEFKNIKITRADGTAYDVPEAQVLAQPSTRGQWALDGETLRQTSNIEDARVVFGDAAQGDYTLSLQARKTGGSEGFLVMFTLPDDGARVWWNIGGWKNTEHGLELPGAAVPNVKGSIETGRWYDIRVELKGATVKCYLDGQLIQQATRTATPELFAVSGRDAKTGEAILQIVNAASSPMAATVDLRAAKLGAATKRLSGRAIVLTSASPQDENAFEQPNKVVPRETNISVSPVFERQLPAHSVTVLRLK